MRRIVPFVLLLAAVGVLVVVLRDHPRATTFGRAQVVRVVDGDTIRVRLDGRTERAVLDVDSDPLYDPFVRQVARTLGDGFRGLPTLGELEDVMRIIWHAYQTEREGLRHV